MANDIDFSTGLTLEQVEVQATLGTAKSTWVKTLTNLSEAAKAGQAEYDMFYKVGTFKNQSGAQTAIRGIKNDHADELPAAFDLRPVVKVDPNDANKRISELWAAVAAPDDEEDEVDEEVEEDPKPKARGRK